ncbi:tyrosine-type recombinase/integrase [Brevibacillus laterosporus]|uniref:Site-specific integrase n=1 Tax=Brevibacillus laterosporus TaxID=1465 RepID=A0AAP8QAJ8_BRELA|nr:tyrosine-type recombinase/integrase [Brevibacillus laterosporus]PPA91515.1 site-specific integrase [Brevibacillus laterosporus]
MPAYKDDNAKKNPWYFTINYKENEKYKKMLRQGFKTKKEAESAMVEAQNALNKGTYIEPSKMTYIDFMHNWLEDKKTTVKARTLEFYSFLVKRHILPTIGGLELSKITPRDIQSLYNSLKEAGNLSDENIRKVHTIINDSLDKAFRWEMIAKNPASLVDSPKVSRKEIVVWDENEIQQFLATAKESRYYVAFLIALTTGMRQGEILGLRWKDIDEDNRTFSIVQTLSHDGKEFNVGAKSDSGNRRISIDEQTLNQILKLKHRYKVEMLENRPLYKDHDLVICTSVGTPLSPRNLNRSFDSIIKKGKVRKIRFHDMRHTHASLLLKQGVNPKIVSERLGHANVRITLDTYSHLLPNLQKETVDEFGKIFYKPQAN